MHAPVPLQMLSVQPFPSSVHGVPNVTSQLSADSSHEPEHSPPPAQGSPGLTQEPLEQTSAPLQNTPSSQEAELLIATQNPAPLH
jgi:hypothetical protein